MSYTPDALDLLVSACDRADTLRRVEFMEDLRCAMGASPEDFRKRIRAMRDRVKRGN